MVGDICANKRFFTALEGHLCNYSGDMSAHGE